MSSRKGLAAAVTAALLASCGVAMADSSAFTLDQPATLDTAAPPRTPLMSLADRAGVGKTLDDWHVSVGGWAEASWTYNMSAPDTKDITARVFDFENEDLTLNQIDVFIQRLVNPAKGQFDVGGRLDILYGADARLVHSLGLFDWHGIYNVPADAGVGANNQWDPQQAYLDFAIPVGNGLLVRAGKFDTLLGYEVINPTANPFYSHSYAFGFAIPFTNTGVIATYVLNPEWTFTAGITRGWDTSTEDDNDTIDVTGQVQWQLKPNQQAIVSFIIGPDQPGDNSNYRTVIDGIFKQKLADNLQLAFNGDYGYEANSTSSISGSDAQWYGVSGYASYGLDRPLANSPMFVLNGRLEYFNDQDGARGLGTAVYEATAGVTITPFPDDAIGQNLKVRPELRFDYGQDPVFDGGTKYNEVTFGVDAYFAF